MQDHIRINHQQVIHFASRQRQGFTAVMAKIFPGSMMQLAGDLLCLEVVLY